jgi:hypothetical protein
MERDPENSKVSFFRAEVSFEIETPEDVVLVLGGLRKAAELFKENYGHVGYPILLVGHEGQS